MTPQQKQKLFDLGYSPTKIAAYERARNIDPAPTEPGIRDRLADVGNEMFDTVGENLRGEGEFVGQTPLRRGVQAVAGVASAVPQGAVAAVPGSVGEELRKGVGYVGDKIGKGFRALTGAIGGTDLFQGAAGRQEVDPETGVSTYVPNNLGLLEEGLGITAATGEIAGNIAGAQGVAGTLGRTASVASKLPGKAVSTAKALTPTNIKKFHSSLAPETKAQAVDAIYDSYKASLLTGDSGLTKALRKESAKQSFGDNKLSGDDLVRNLSDEGIIPEVNGTKTDFTLALDELSERQNNLFKEIDPVLATVPTLTPLQGLRASALEAVRRSDEFVENRSAAVKQTEKFFDEFEESFGANLTAQQVELISKRMNSRTKSFDKEAYVQDTANIVGRAARNRIDEIAPSPAVRAAHLEYGRLQNLKNTALLLDGKKIQISFLSEALGRYGGVLAAASIGGAIVTGSGALVIAGLAAKLGGDKIAQFMRNRAFSKAARNKVAETIKQDQTLAKQLIDEASDANKATLERLLLPAGPIVVGARTSESVVKGVPAKRGLPRQNPKTGKMERTFTTEPQTTEKIRQSIEENLNVSSSPNISQNKQAGFVSLGKKIPAREKALLDYIRQQEKVLNNTKGNTVFAKNVEKSIGEARKMLDEMEGKAKAATPESTDLLSQAKGKTLDEFVESQGTPVYHGTDKAAVINKEGFSANVGERSLASGGDKQPGVFVYPEKESAAFFAKNFDNGGIVEAVVDGKIYNANTLTKYGWEDDLSIQTIATRKNILKKLKEDGYVGVESTEVGTPATFIFEPQSIKTRSQLEDIWKKAN